ncbi:nicotinamide riboside transporter PnuC [Neptunicella marina]|uniref:Nicotinamide riboside transporter PnuC n=1 Tax=Neptunicella marina TaxID=2125989 RepID=A0A8J6ISV7_9ALTE|nr:nicotinamide riboside transporter PnuC [Neptunicella marina]MBC3765102.1 nicotinamide mononucleotide transporter [Neptunicella marina]
MSLISTLGEQWQQQSPWEIVAVVLAVAYVWLAAKQHIACWLCALISTGIYVGLMWEVSLPMQSLLNLYYLIMAIYGWYCWRKPKQGVELKVHQMNWQTHLMIIAGLLVISAGLIAVVGKSFSPRLPELDVLVTVFSLYATWLETRKVLESWLYWQVINTAGIYLCWATGLYLTALLLCMYLGFAFYGYRQWQQDMNLRQQEPECA